MENYESIEQLDKHKRESQQCAEISQTSTPPDSWVSQVSCNSDECFLCADMKFHVDKLSKIPQQRLNLDSQILLKMAQSGLFSFSILSVFDGSE